MFTKSIIIALLFTAILTQAMKKHYGNPLKGCLSDEAPAGIQGMNGDVCMPKCTYNGCPMDLPDSQTTAKPSCLVQDGYGNKYCVLQCVNTVSKCPNGATCQRPPHAEEKNNRVLQAMKFTGFCMYPRQVMMMQLTGEFPMDN